LWHARVALIRGWVVRGDRVFICSGGRTPALFGPLSVEFDPHTRFTYLGADAAGVACLSAPEGYRLPLGSTGCWAFGPVNNNWDMMAAEPQ
jgi:sarcosine oxidase